MEQLLVKLNSLYSELEYETDNKYIKQIKRQIREIDKKLKDNE